MELADAVSPPLRGVTIGSRRAVEHPQKPTNKKLLAEQKKQTTKAGRKNRHAVVAAVVRLCVVQFVCLSHSGWKVVTKSD